MRQIFLLYFFIQTFSTQSQISIYTNSYQRNWQLVNPAAVDRVFYSTRNNNAKTMLSGNIRTQWIGLEDAPITAVAALSQYIGDNTRLGGLAIIDKSGAFLNYGIHFNYTHAFDFDNGRNLYAGLAFGHDWQTITFSNPNNDSEDPFLKEPLGKKFNFSSGLFYRVTSNSMNFIGASNIEEFYFGLSMNNILGIHLNSKSPNNNSFINRTLIAKPDFALIGGCIWGESSRGGSSRDQVFETYSIIRYLPNQSFLPYNSKIKFPFSIDLGARYFLSEQLFFGGSYGTNQMVGGEIGCMFKKEKITQFTLFLNTPMGNRFARLGPSIEIAASIAWK